MRYKHCWCSITDVPMYHTTSKSVQFKCSECALLIGYAHGDFLNAMTEHAF